MTAALDRPRSGRSGRLSAARSRLFTALPVVLAGTLTLGMGASPADAAPKRSVKSKVTRPAVPDVQLVAAAGELAETAAVEITQAATGPAQSLAPREYAVVEGDTVSDIAARFGLSTASVLALNGLSWKSLIFPGQKLSLNTASTAPVYADTPLVRYTITPGDTISGIAASHGIATEAVLLANGLGRDSIIFPGQSIVLPVEAPATAQQDSGAIEPASPKSVVALSDTMRKNAEIIVRIGRELGVPDRGIIVALAASAQESALHNLDWGHLDSLGLFQQRPSMGWGTAEQIVNPEHSVRAFFGGRQNPNEDTRGLLDVQGWQSLTVAQAAQAVQLSAYPDAYAKWEASATAWLELLG